LGQDEPGTALLVVWERELEIVNPQQRIVRQTDPFGPKEWQLPGMKLDGRRPATGRRACGADTGVAAAADH
jgi:hypothetical protein